MNGSIRPRLPILLLPLLLGCAGGASSGDPFGGGPTRAETSETHSVRFQVSCAACYITWSVDRYGGRTQEEGRWSERATVTADPSFPARAQLTASALPGSGPVRWVRITVDGDVAAEARADGGGVIAGGHNALSVAAEIPPRDPSPIIAGGNAPE